MEIPSSFNPQFEMYKNNYSAGSSKSDLMEMAAIAQDDSEQGLELAAREFTGMFMGRLLKEMRSTIDIGELGHGGEAENTFQGMLDDEWARNIAYNGDIKTGGGGIVGMVHESLQRRSGADAYKESV